MLNKSPGGKKHIRWIDEGGVGQCSLETQLLGVGVAFPRLDAYANNT